MLTKLPIIGSPLKATEWAKSLGHINDRASGEHFKLSFSKLCQAKYIYFTNSGISSFYIILKALREKSLKKEVILPAYTAGSLVVAIIKAGLLPVLCDINLEDFNLENESLFKAMSSNTLAIVCAHMFGIAVNDIENLKEKIPPGIFLIEDCAQALGSKIKGKPVGNFGDVAFFSFNRGKNIPAYGGGAVITNSDILAEKINTIYKDLVIDSAIIDKFSAPFKMAAFSLAVNPFIYRMGQRFISYFKEISPPLDFAVKKNTPFQLELISRSLRRLEELSAKRYHNGLFLINNLEGIKDLILPLIPKGIYPAFNRFPVVFRDLNKKEKVEQRMQAAGIEASPMYLKPLHHLFDLGYSKEDFPQANYFAEHLLTLPVHPTVRERDLAKMVKVIKETI